METPTDIGYSDGGLQYLSGRALEEGIVGAAFPHG